MNWSSRLGSELFVIIKLWKIVLLSLRGKKFKSKEANCFKIIGTFYCV